MGKIEKIYRMRRGVLFAAFVCSLFLFGTFCLFVPVASLFSGGSTLSLGVDLVRKIFLFAGIFFALLLLILFVRFLVFRAATRKNPALRAAVDDERIRTNWLRSYRAAALTIIGINGVNLFAESLLMEIGLPNVVWLSASISLAVLFGAAILYSREEKNERA